MAAQLCGVMINRVNEMVFVLSAGIAGATGFMMAMKERARLSRRFWAFGILTRGP